MASLEVADASEYLAITGRGLDDVKLAKKAWVWAGQQCRKFDTKAHVATKMPRAPWVLGLCIASAAVTLVVCEPPAGVDKGGAYYLAVSGAFFAAVAGVMAAVLAAN